MDTKVNYFVRILIVLLTTALSVLVFMSCIHSEPAFAISPGLITLIGIITIIVLSESFNSLSIGKLLNLKREVEKKETEVIKVSKENSELRGELFKIVSNVQQSQVNNTFNAPPESWLKLLGVVPAKENPEEETEEIIAEEAVSQPQTRPQERVPARDRFKERRAAKEFATRKFIESLDIPQSEILINVEFSSAFQGIDPIMEKRLVFDAYVKGVENESFYEFRIESSMSSMFFDRLYLTLSKIYLYGKAKNIHAHLVLVLVDMPEEEEARRPFRPEKIYEWFQPAIANKLLKIERVSVGNDEIQETFEGSRQQNLL